MRTHISKFHGDFIGYRAQNIKGFLISRMADSVSDLDISSNGTTRSVVGLVSIHDFRTWVGIALKYQRYESLCSLLLSYLELCGVSSPENRTDALQKLFSELEIAVEEKETRDREASLIFSK